MPASMEPLHASTIKLFFFIFFAVFAFKSSTTTAATVTRPRKLVTKLIHRDSILSPYYNPRATRFSNGKHALKSSITRLAYLQHKLRPSPFNINDDIRTPIVAEESGAQFMANFSIGDPPVPQFLTIDTGSNLLWVQCQPCVHCFEQSSPIFDPSKSSTYANLSCNSPSCTVTPSDKCDPLNNCKFNLGYLDGTTVKGIIGNEKMTFETSDEGIISVSNTIFGCGHDNNGYNGQPSGILGLGPDNISLVTKLGSKFSYCLGSIRDPQYTHNLLILGDGAITQGDSTSLEVYKSLYFLDVQGISVGDKMLDIDQQVFKRTLSGTGGVVIDSGTTVTFLVKGAFQPLSEEVKRLLQGVLEPVEDPDDPTKVCYKGNITQDLKGFPVVTVQFSGGAGLGLEVGSLFQENGPGEFCLAVHLSMLNDLNVIGIMAQQGYNIGYDIAGKKIYFQSIECELLDG